MKSKNKRLLIIMLVVSILFGCDQESTTSSTTMEKGEYKIGAILPLTGSAAEDGEFQKQGIELAVAKINKLGGINEKWLSVIFEDSQNQAKLGISALNRLIQQDKVPVVIATMSGVSAPLAAYAGNKVPVVVFSTVASVPNITKHGDNIFRAFVTSDVESIVIAEYMREKDFSNMVVLYVNDDYGIGGKQEFIRKFKVLGGKVVAEYTFEKGETNHRNLVAKVINKKPDAVFIVGYDKSFALLIKQLRQTAKSLQLVTTSPLSVPSWRKLAGAQANGTYLSNSWFHYDDSDPLTLEFDRAYEKMFGKHSNYLSAASYTTVMMIADAIREGGYSKTGIQNALNNIKKRKTLLGVISMDNNREASFPVRMARLIDGQIVNLK